MNRLKISYNKETKKLSAQLTSYTQLIEQLSKAFSSQHLPDNFKLYYKDDEGDLISITNDDELQGELSSIQHASESIRMVIAANADEAIRQIDLAQAMNQTLQMSSSLMSGMAHNAHHRQTAQQVASGAQLLNPGSDRAGNPTR
jgi:PB1 domain